MNTKEDAGVISSDLKSELHEALENLRKGIRDADAARKASERMDRMREENRKLFGEQNIAVELIRETRDRR